MSFPEELLKEINECRTNPKEYAKKVEKYISYFKGKTLIIPGKNAGLKTEEGAEAYKEAVDYLSKVEPVESLESSKGLARISKDFLDEVQKVDPSELGNINVDEIIKKYGSFVGSMNREVDFGNETPEEVVVSLIVSDGDATRGHRDCLLSTDLKKYGAAYGKHNIYGFCSIIFFCTTFKNDFDEDDNGFLDGDNSNTKKEAKKEEKTEGQTLKPRKVVLKQAPKEEEKPKEEPIEVINNDEEEREDVVSEKRNEKIVIENGKKKKIITITRTLVDGSKEVETIKKIIKEGEE